MKQLRLIILLVLVSIATHPAQAQKHKRIQNRIQWLTFAQLEQAMKQEPRHILIDVEADWCVYCKMLDKTTLSKNKVINALNKDFYAVKLNAEKSQKIRFGGHQYPYITQSNGKGVQSLALSLKAKSYPSLVILSPDYEILHRHNGYIKAKKLAPLLSYLGSEKYKTQSWKDFTAEYKRKKKRGKK